MKNANEILEAFGLDFTIIKTPLFAEINGNQVQSPYFGLVNSQTNQIINSVKAGYHVSQNKDVLELVLQGMAPFGDNLDVQKAGSINGGRKVFLQLRIEGDGNVNGDKIERYVTIIDSNDGSTSLSIGIGDLTMSCQNQFMKFYKAGISKFRHTDSLTKRMAEIPELIKTALSASLKQVEIYKQLESTPVSKQLAHELVKYILGYDRELTSMEKLAEQSTRAINKMDAIYNHIDKETAQKGMNLWGLHSGITSYTTHDLSAPNRDNGRVESIIGGTAYKMNQLSHEFVVNKAGILVDNRELVLA